MDVAITGSSGLVGTALVAALRWRGDRAVRLVRREPTTDDELRWDPDAATIAAEPLEGLDAVVHLAGAGIGEKKWTSEQKRRILESRTLGTGLLAEALAHLGRKPLVLVSGSAVGWYGNRGCE